jgi:hypothetical protein
MAHFLSTQGFLGASVALVALEGFSAGSSPSPISSTICDQGAGDPSGLCVQGFMGFSPLPPSATPTLRAAVYYRLTQLDDLADLVGVRIYPDRPPQSWVPSSGPVVIYSVESEQRDTDLDGVASTAAAVVNLKVASPVLADCEQGFVLLTAEFPAADVVLAGLTVDAILIEGESESFDYLPDGLDTVIYGVSQDFTVLYQTG